MTPLAEMLETFTALPGWEHRYEYVIELGRELPEFPQGKMVEENRVRGCTSTVYLLLGWKNDKLDVQLVSDALIVSGMLAIVRAAYHGQTRAGAAAVDLPGVLAQSNLLEHLSPNRRHGFASVVAKIRSFVA